MDRLSQTLLPTERQPPADAEALSHKLMVRAGLIRQVGSGLWSWMPVGWKVHGRAVQIVREEIDAIGGQEIRHLAHDRLVLARSSGSREENVSVKKCTPTIAANMWIAKLGTCLCSPSTRPMTKKYMQNRTSGCT